MTYVLRKIVHNKYVLYNLNDTDYQRATFC